MDFDLTEAEQEAASHALRTEDGLGMASHFAKEAAKAILASHNEYVDLNPSIKEDGFKHYDAEEFDEEFARLSDGLEQYYLNLLSRRGLLVLEPKPR